MIVLDAGVLIGLLDQDDVHHGAAVGVLEENQPPYLVHTLTLAEGLVGPTRRGEGDAALRDLQSIGIETATMGAGEALELARLRTQHRLKMPDTCVLAAAVISEAPIATFDRRLAGVAAELGLLL